MKWIRCLAVAAVAALATVSVFVAGQLVAPAAAATLNVDNTNASCSDVTGDPYCTIQAAIDAAGVGDTINVAAGTYSETLRLDGTKAADISVIGADKTTTFITGGVRFEGSYTGLSVENFTITGDGRQRPGLAEATVGASSSASVVTDAQFSNNIFDGEGITGVGGGRFGVYLSSISGSFTFENNEVKNYRGWGTLELNQACLTVTSYVFTDNYIHDNSGSSALRGNASDRTDTVTVSGNTFDNNGGGDSWASIEVNEAEAVTVSGNTITNTQAGSWGEGEALQVWHIASLTVTDNVIEDNYQGIYFPGGTWSSDLSGVEIHYNSIAGNTQFGLQADAGNTGTGDASRNWWGHATGPDHSSNPHGTGQGGDVASDGFVLTPWYATGTTTPSTENVSVEHNPVIAVSDTIQGGIDASLDGDTVSVAAGTYDGFKVDSKADLTVVGTGDPVVSGDKVSVPVTSSSCPVDSEALVAVQNSSGVTIDGLTVDASGYLDNCFSGIIYYQSSGTIQACTIQNIEGTGGQKRSGILAQAGSALAVLDNTISEYDKAGIVSRAMDSIDIERNVITTTYHGTAPNGIDIGTYHGTSATIKDNEISGADYDQFDAGEYETEWNGSGILVIEAGDSLEVSGNTVQNSDVALDVESDSASVTENDLSSNLYGVVLWNANLVINFNSIAGNTSYGVYRTAQGDPTGTVDATGNWWGDVSGPFHATHNPDGTGNAAGDNTAYSPWLGIGTDADPGTPGFQPVSPMTFIVEPQVCLPVGCIQQAVNLAGSPDTAQVEAGTYNENVLLDRAVSLLGLAGATVVGQDDGTGAVGCFWAKDLDTWSTKSFTIDGFTCEGGTYYGVKVSGGVGGTLDSMHITNNVFHNSGLTPDPLREAWWNGAVYFDVMEWHWRCGVPSYPACVDSTFSGVGEISHNTIYNDTTDKTQLGIGVRSGKNVVIDDNTVYGNVAEAIHTWGGAAGSTNDDYQITNNEIDLTGYVGDPAVFNPRGIWNYGSHSTISGNTVISKWVGIVIEAWDNSCMGGPESGSNFRNTVSGNTVHPPAGEEMVWGIVIQADYNTVTGNEVYGVTYGANGKGMNLRLVSEDPCDYWIHGSTDHNTISGNNIHDNDHGLYVMGDNNTLAGNDILDNTGASTSGVHLTAGASANQIVYNNIVGNSPGGYGVYNANTGETLNAEYNWWGACDGPSGVGPGSGDAVSDYVDYEPWVHGGCDYDGDLLTDDQETLIVGTLWQNPDTDGDGCSDGREYLVMEGFRPQAPYWYDFYDVPAPANADPTPNGPRNAVVDIADALAVLFYAFAQEGGAPNGNGVAYDSLKDGDWNGPSGMHPDGVVDALDKVGLRYDRSKSPSPNPPFDAGVPNGVIDISDALTALAQFGLSCSASP